MQSFIYFTNLKVYLYSIEDYNKSFTRSNYLYKHIIKSTNLKYKKKYNIFFERKYCFLYKKSFNKPSDLVRHKKNSYKDFNKFKKDFKD